MSVDEMDPDLDSVEDDLDESDEAEEVAPVIHDTETASDPVRMYLKEIGQVQLLDADQEIWLSAQISASTRVVAFTSVLGLLPDDDMRPVITRLASEIEIAWNDVAALAAVFELDPPAFAEIAAEAGRLREGWTGQPPSYLRRYLELREWGRDQEWTHLAQQLFIVFEALYALPTPLLQLFVEHDRQFRSLPSAADIQGWIDASAPTDAAETIRGILYWSEEAVAALTRANLRLVVSVAKKYMGRGISFLDLIQ
ncbi:MAG: hypothetical protein IT326_02760, partial [Anaerolineae bacterium]|nr:hypothetical protein [Anaerolineae bacterium]